MNANLQREAERQYARDAKAIEPGAFRRLSAQSHQLLREAEAQSRCRDDDHIGTEHIVLGIFALECMVATSALRSVGITARVFAEQLAVEPGPSPIGAIPLTPRARMIVGLAGIEATRLGADLVEPEHILFGVIHESQRWTATGQVGPHHLRAAADAVGTTLSALEEALRREMDAEKDRRANGNRPR